MTLQYKLCDKAGGAIIWSYWHSKDINTTFFIFCFCRTPVLVLRLGVDFALPLSQEQEEQEEQPTPKSIIGECTKRLI